MTRWLRNVMIADSEIEHLSFDHVEKGTLVVRTDLGQDFIHIGTDTGTMADWQDYSDDVTEMLAAVGVHNVSGAAHADIRAAVEAAQEAADSGSVAISSAKQWAANPDSLIAGVITRDANGAATSAPVVWPDGDTGTYTATTVSTAFPGAVDAYTITKGALTYTQPLMTRDANGAVTNRPAITVV